MNSRHIKPFETNGGLPDDNGLWEAFKLGDKSAFSKIYHRHVDALYNYGMHFIQDPFIIKESIQDLFVTLWSTKANLGETNNIRFYLLRSLRRKLAKHSKEQKPWESFSKDEKFGLKSFLNNRAFDQFSKSETDEKIIAQKLTQALTKLPSRQKEALYHIYYEDLSYEEVAALMNVNIKTVYNLAWRGIESLRKSLSKSSFFSLPPIILLSALKSSFELLEKYQ